MKHILDPMFTSHEGFRRFVRHASKIHDAAAAAMTPYDPLNFVKQGGSTHTTRLPNPMTRSLVAANPTMEHPMAASIEADGQLKACTAVRSFR